MQPVVPLWDPNDFEAISFERYEPFYPTLFQCLRGAGWAPSRARPIPPETLARLRRVTWDCYYGDQLLQAFGGLRVHARPTGELGRYLTDREVCFEPGGAFDLLVADPRLWGVLDETVASYDVFAVAETEGHVLFVGQRGEAVLIEQSLAGYMVGDNAFSVLSRFLIGEHHADVRVVTLREGY